MLEVDFHTHSLFSLCGLHTHIELLSHAKALGLKALAVSDHGPKLHSRIPTPFYDRLCNPVPGIKLLKGMECNICSQDGDIDVPRQYLHYLDVVLVGFHANVERGLGKEKNTDIMIAAIENNPCIDIVVHPNELEYPVHFSRLALAAKKYGVALELNNSKTLYKRTSDQLTRELIETCRDVGCSMVINSDTHALHEIGCDESVRPYVHELCFPDELLINSSAEKALAFVAQRKSNKTK